MINRATVALCLVALSLQCIGGTNNSVSAVAPRAAADPTTGIRTAADLQASIFADGIGKLRHMVVHSSGAVLGALAEEVNGKGIVLMRDDDDDGTADTIGYFADDLSGTGMAIDGDLLYYGADDRVLRFKLDADGRVMDKPRVVVGGFTINNMHDTKSITLDGAGNLYVNFGVPSNACMKKSRSKGSPGMQPCPILESYGGVWRFDANATGQVQSDGELYSTGHRNAVALEWNHIVNALYLVNHGRDQLSTFFPEFFNDEKNAELPAEEFHRVDKGDDLGWPYSYYDHRLSQRMLMPEYGGDGKKISTTGKRPLIGFPGHWAPNDLLFPSPRSGLPPGALIAFHGSWNRSPLPQQGYRVVFAPMTSSGQINGDWVTVADGFAGKDKIAFSRDAKHRPTGLAEGPDGALYVSSRMSGGRVWRLVHKDSSTL